MDYSVRKSSKGWIVTNETTGAFIGALRSRREAINIARLLAGWSGNVTILAR